MSILRVNEIQNTVGTNAITIDSNGNTLMPGHVLQTVSTTKTDHFSTASTSWTDITDLSVTITPLSSSSKILVLASVYASASDSCFLRLERGGVAIGTGIGGENCYAMVRFSASNLGSTFSTNYLDSPSTTSSTTYKVQGHTDGGSTLYINRRGSSAYPYASSHLTLMEIAQ